MPLFSESSSVCVSDDGMSDDGLSHDGSCSLYERDEFLIDSFLDKQMTDDEDVDDSKYGRLLEKSRSSRSISSHQLTRSTSNASESAMRSRQMERAARRQRYSTDIHSTGNNSTINTESKKCDHVSGARYDDDKDYLMMMISPNTDDENEKYARRKRNEDNKHSTPKIRNSQRDRKSEDEVDSLLKQLEKFKLKYAQAQSDADHFKFQYRKLNADYAEMQKICTKLGNENKSLKQRKQLRKHNSYMSSNTSVTSASTMTTMSSSTSWLVQSLERIIPNKKNTHRQKLRSFQEFHSDDEQNESSIIYSNESSDNELQNSHLSGSIIKLPDFLSQQHDSEQPIKNISFTRRNQLSKQISTISLCVDNEVRIISPVSSGDKDVVKSSYSGEEFSHKVKDTSTALRHVHKCKPLRGRERSVSVDLDDFDDLDLSDSPNFSERTGRSVESEFSEFQ